jgi:hypothetical protein
MLDQLWDYFISAMVAFPQGTATVLPTIPPSTVSTCDRRPVVFSYRGFVCCFKTAGRSGGSSISYSISFTNARLIVLDFAPMCQSARMLLDQLA